MAKTTKAQKALLTGMIAAVEAGESYTILRHNQPVAMVLPIADWQALQGKWLSLLGLTPPPPSELDDDEFDALSPLEQVMATAMNAHPDADLPVRRRRERREIADERGDFSDYYRPPGVFTVANPMTPTETAAHRALSARAQASAVQAQEIERRARAGGGSARNNRFLGASSPHRSPEWIAAEHPPLQREGPVGQGGLSGTVVPASENIENLPFSELQAEDRRQAISRARMRAEINAQVEARVERRTNTPDHNVEIVP